MRKAGLIVLTLSLALTVLSLAFWLLGLITGIGGALIHLLLLSAPLWIIGVVVGVVLLVIGARGATQS